MTFLRKMIFSTKSVKFFDTFAEQDNSFFSFSILFLPVFRFFPSIFFSSTYRKVYVSVDISLNIRGYFITYPRIFHYASAVTRVFCFVLAIYWLYAFVFSHMDWHKFFCSDLLSEVTHTGKHYRKKKSKKRFFRWKLSNFLTLLAESGSKKPLFLKKSLGRSQTESSGKQKSGFIFCSLIRTFMATPRKYLRSLKKIKNYFYILLAYSYLCGRKVDHPSKT